MSGALVALGRGPTPGAAPAGHLPLGTGEFCGASFPVLGVGQVVGRVGGRRGGGDTPVDADPTIHLGGRFGGAADHERRVPVAEGIPIHPDTGRVGRELPGPHDGDADPTGENETTVLDLETPGGVLQGRKSGFAALEHRTAPTLDLERMLEGLTVGAQRLLLGDLRSVPHPSVAGALVGEHFRQGAQGGFVPDPLLVDGLIPQEPTATPLGVQCGNSSRAGTQPIVVPHCLLHGKQYTRRRVDTRTWLHVTCTPWKPA